MAGRSLPVKPIKNPPPGEFIRALYPRQKADRRYNALRNKYFSQGWRTHHQDIVDFIQPRRGRFLPTDRMTAGHKKDGDINNNVATIASNTLRAGLHSGVTSSARPWFKLTTHDPALNEVDEVKAWLAEAERITQGVIAKSSFYLRIEELYGDVADFGTAAFYIEADDEEYIRCFVFPIGSFFVANGPKGVVDTIARETSMTCDELVRKFGLDSCCLQVKLAYKRGDLDLDFDLVHMIVPNDGFIPGAIGTKGKKWLSLWWEKNRRLDEGFLSDDKGYDYFPCMVPRWQVNGTDAYGSSPGMNALADVRALQHLEEQAMGVVDKTVAPPMNVPSSMRGQQASLLPGAENYTRGPGEKMEPAIVVNPQALPAVQGEIARHEQRIRTAYHADLFRLLEMLQQQGQEQMTAYEVQQRIQEKMQQLGPAYERLEEELLDPALDAIMHLCMEWFLYPPIPQTLAGAQIKVEYTSIVAMAQKASVLGAVDQFLARLGQISAVDHDILDLVDFDTVARDYSEKLGNPPKYLRPADVVAQMRIERGKMLAQQQQQQQAMAAIQGAKTLSETDTGGENALTKLLGPNGRGNTV